MLYGANFSWHPSNASIVAAVSSAKPSQLLRWLAASAFSSAPFSGLALAISLSAAMAGQLAMAWRRRSISHLAQLSWLSAQLANSIMNQRQRNGVMAYQWQ